MKYIIAVALLMLAGCAPEPQISGAEGVDTLGSMTAEDDLID
jgi:hypothetical protein